MFAHMVRRGFKSVNKGKLINLFVCFGVSVHAVSGSSQVSVEFMLILDRSTRHNYSANVYCHEVCLYVARQRVRLWRSGGWTDA